MKILVIEDDLDVCFIKRGLEKNPGLEVLTATTIEKAEEVFNENPDLNIVVLDGNLIQGGFNQKTVSLAKKIQTKFKGIMIAMSGDEEIQKELMKVPCNYAVEKYKLVKFVKNLLSIA